MSRLVVLMYHRVATHSSGPLAHLTMPAERFAWQMQTLRRSGFRPVTQAMVAAWLCGIAALPPRAVVVTFDDGYADNVTHAFPVLERLRIPAVTFVVTAKLGGTNDWDRPAAPWPLMDAAAIRDWHQRGLEFGAHGRTHRSLAGLTGEALADEVAGSHADLKALLGETPTAFAYPFGDIDDAARRKVAERYPVAYGVRPGTNRANGDRHQLRRTAVLPAYPEYEFLCQLRLGWGPRDRARGFVRRALGRVA